MAGGDTSAGATYSNKVGFVYIFNLVVGVGALALPSGFKEAGLILGIIFLAIMACLAYITITWINETQSTANAIMALQERGIKDINSLQEQKPLLNNPDYDEEEDANKNVQGGQSVTSIFDIKRRVELGLMSEMFLGKWGQKAFYATLIIYLYGDLAIYSVSVPSSLAKVTGGIPFLNMDEHDSYYIFLAIFCVAILPWTMFNFQKTKWLQLATVITRNVALFTMITLATIYIAEGHGTSDVPWFRPLGLPSLFGVSVYAFMCHHSLPGLITPIRDKRNINKLMLGDFTTILATYSLLCTTALFAFGSEKNDSCDPHPGDACKIQPLYTFNFNSYDFRPLAVFLTLFPVFTLSSNFPLIAITLRNNLVMLIPYGESNPRLRQIGFSLIATGPPMLLAFFTRDVDLLVSVTGSYAGLGIMFIIPAVLVLNSRKALSNVDPALYTEHPFKSPFGSKIYVYVIIVATVLSAGLI
eukprot:CAMPEP_0168564300 /NCGR_PEP_ID=MMETSP0413-20121227/13167_1 /TAXON_ID=136452 /ORGANISM="Filamoeba nolandi, Strain NC-AS-23-1" /LENGTH=470 /DNA_ID=CAMNT_0008595953 /DNA_START=23 /DNA_END=1432 /DNA_ORIENTATION=-